MKFRLALILAIAMSATPACAQGNGGGGAVIVAAENFYGDIARQIAGPQAQVRSILSSPDDDPHLFEVSPSVARDLATAKIVIYNGVDYDPWMPKLLLASKATERRVIVVGDLLHKKPGVNPHLWYDPSTAQGVAKAISAALSAYDPPRKGEYDQRLQVFLASLKPVDDKVAEMRKQFAGTPVTATEPVFGYLAAALGLKMRNERFQLAVMNDTEPAASDVAVFESDLRDKRVKLFIYNSQATSKTAQRLANLAKESKIPVIGVTETQPEGTTFQEWMLTELDAVQKALTGAN